MRVVLLFYTDFGAQKGKGIESHYTIKELWRKGYIHKVIVRDVEQTFLAGELLQRGIPLGSLIPRLFGGVEKFLFPGIPSRYLGEALFDRFAAKKLPADGEILYAVPRMICSMKRAKELGYTTILHSGELHPTWNQKLIAEEYEKLGIKVRNPAWSSRMFERYLQSIELADYIVVHSDFAKQVYLEENVSEAKILVNPLGVDVNKFKPDNIRKTDEFIYLFVGNLSVIKGVHYLLHAWQALNLKDAKLVICGSKGIDFQQIIKHFLPLPSVELTGYTDPLPYYKRASVFIFPSLSENPGKVVLEAMASGLPVIVTPSAGSVVRDGVDGFVVPMRDVEALRDKMLYFYNNPDKIEIMGRSAREQAERYSWEAYSERVVRILEDIWEREAE